LSDLGIVEKASNLRERERERELKNFGCLLDVIEKSLEIWEFAK
jgi:hypothetical protein